MSNLYCIGCNSTDKDVVNLYKHPNRLDKMFASVIDFNILEDTYLCDDCDVKLRIAYNFKTQCLAVLKLYDLEPPEVSPKVPENRPQSICNQHSPPLILPPIEIIDSPPPQIIKSEDSELAYHELYEEIEEETEDQYHSVEMETVYFSKQNNSSSVSEKDVDLESVDEIDETDQNTEFLETLDEEQSEIKPADLQETFAIVNQPKKEGKQRRSFTTSVKLRLVDYAEKHGNYQTARDFNLSEASVRGWRKQKKLLLSSDKGTRRAFRKGAPHWPQLEVKLRTWIADQHSCHRTITDEMIKVKALSIGKESGITNFVCSKRWCEAFKARGGLNNLQQIEEQNEIEEIVEVNSDEMVEEVVPESKTRGSKKTQNWRNH